MTVNIFLRNADKQGHYYKNTVDQSVLLITARLFYILCATVLYVRIKIVVYVCKQGFLCLGRNNLINAVKNFNAFTDIGLML